MALLTIDQVSGENIALVGLRLGDIDQRQDHQDVDDRDQQQKR